MAALVLHLRRMWRNDDGLELRAWSDAALPRWGKGRCGVRGRRCLPRWGKGAAVWRAWFWLVRGEMLFMRRFALQEGLAGAPGGGEKPLCVFARILRGLADAPGARGDGGDGRFARGENCPLFPRPPRFRNHPAGRPAGSARTRPRDQSLGYPFLGSGPHLLLQARRLMGENATFPDRTFRSARP